MLKIKFVALFFLVVFFTLYCIKINNTKLMEINIATPKALVNEPSHNSDVILEILEKTQKEIILRISNNMNSPIFVIYEQSKRDSDIFFVPYSLSCSEGNGGYKEYAPEWHTLPTRKQLNGGATIKFKVDSLPIYDGICNLTVRYFNSIEAVRTHEKFLDENFEGYTAEEKDIIEKAKKDVTISFKVRSN